MTGTPVENTGFLDLLRNYRSKGLLVDTNLLLLYLAGSYEQRLIGRFKRIAKYDAADFIRVSSMIRLAGSFVSTPHILTEVSNLSMQMPERDYQDYFRWVARTGRAIHERQIDVQRIFSNEHFPKMGITDSGIMELAPNSYLVLTDDFPLANRLEHMKVDVINYNHVRFSGIQI